MMHRILSLVVALVLTASPAYAQEKVSLAVTQLHDSVKSNSLSIVEKMLDAKPEFVNAVDERGVPPLVHATSSQMAELLLRRGANMYLRVPKSSGGAWTPLGHHRQRGTPAIQRVLARYDAFELYANKDWAAIQRLLRDVPATVGFHENGGGRPLLSVAAGDGTMEVVNMLLASGADPNAKDDAGHGPVTHAAVGGSREAYDALRAAGAEPDLFASVVFDDITVVRAMLNARPDSVHSTCVRLATPLQYASLAARADVVALLIAHGADVNAKSRNGWTALHSASDRGATDVVRLLLAAGANPLNQADNSASPLMEACRESETGVARLLLKADPQTATQRDSRGLLPIAHMGLAPDPALIKLLVEAAPNEGAGESYTRALALAIRHGLFESVDVLLRAGADPLGTDGKESTAFHVAAQFGRARIMVRLLEEGYKDRSNADRQTPLHLAAMNDDSVMVALLVEAGASLGLRDGTGRTPLQTARGTDNMNAAAALERLEHAMSSDGAP